MKSKIKIIVRGKQVLVKPDSTESRESENGIITPSNVEQEQKAIGTVIAVGSEIKDIKVGDKVIYGIFAGDPIKVDDVEYKFIHDDFILGIWEQ